MIDSQSKAQENLRAYEGENMLVRQELANLQNDLENEKAKTECLREEMEKAKMANASISESMEEKSRRFEEASNRFREAFTKSELKMKEHQLLVQNYKRVKMEIKESNSQIQKLQERREAQTKEVDYYSRETK